MRWDFRWGDDVGNGGSGRTQYLSTISGPATTDTTYGDPTIRSSVATSLSVTSTGYYTFYIGRLGSDALDTSTVAARVYAIEIRPAGT